ncbi:MAG: transporter associated domain-containing protein, partial [Phycisphaeraceae bacterium]
VGEVRIALHRAEVEKLAPGRFSVTADLAIHDWADLFGRNTAVDAVRTTSAISTLGGLVMSRLGRVPEVGDEVTIGSNLKLRVDAMDGSRIDRIVVELSGGGGAAVPTNTGEKEADRG